MFCATSIGDKDTQFICELDLGTNCQWWDVLSRVFMNQLCLLTSNSCMIHFSGHNEVSWRFWTPRSSNYECSYIKLEKKLNKVWNPWYIGTHYDNFPLICRAFYLIASSNILLFFIFPSLHVLQPYIFPSYSKMLKKWS